mgnify:FL=1
MLNNQKKFRVIYEQSTSTSSQEAKCKVEQAFDVLFDVMMKFEQVKVNQIPKMKMEYEPARIS